MPRAELGAVEHLEQRIAEDEDLLAATDHPVVVVVGVRAGLAPLHEAVGPRGGEDVALRLLPPFRDLVRAGDDDSFAGRGLEADRLLRGAALLDGDGLAVDPRVDHDRVAGPGLRAASEIVRS